MSDGQVMGTMFITVAGVFLLMFLIPTAFIYRRNIYAFLISPLVSWRKRKQQNCHHAWRKLDAVYEYGNTVYRYRCTNCEKDEHLNERQSKLFERDFMTEWYEKGEERSK